MSVVKQSMPKAMSVAGKGFVLATAAAAKESWAVITDREPSLNTLWQYGLRFCIPRLHQVLSEEIPRSERSPQMHKADERITELLGAYLDRWRDKISPQNPKLTVFILSRTVDALCHAAVIDSQFEREVSNLLLSYLTNDPVER
jgi:hypothetical protein